MLRADPHTRPHNLAKFELEPQRIKLRQLSQQEGMKNAYSIILLQRREPSHDRCIFIGLIVVNVGVVTIINVGAVDIAVAVCY